MGRGGRRNRKRKLLADDDEYRSNEEHSTVSASVDWWDENSNSHTHTPLDHQPLPFDPTSTSTTKELASLQQYYTLLATKYNWKSPTLVQSHAWPHIFCNKDHHPRHVAFVSATASGKTLVFGLRLLLQAHLRRHNGLVLVPTRELATQVGRNLTQWNQVISMSSTCCDANGTTVAPTILILHGGGCELTRHHVQAITDARDHGPLIMVATPGRFLDVLESIESKQSSKSALPVPSPDVLISTICLDEADRLALQADLSRQVDDILERIIAFDNEQQQQQQQLCLCSATLSANARLKWDGWIRRMAQPDGCVLIQIGGCGAQQLERRSEETRGSKGDLTKQQHQLESATLPDHDSSPPERSSNMNSNMFSRIPSNLTQVLHVCAEHKKPRKLITTIQTARKEYKKSGLGIIFFNRIKTLQFASKLLQKSQIACLELHSQMPQDKRERAIQTFSSGRIPLLLATDVAARGLHIDHVKTVINYDFPSNLEQYIHRCGRAGRANDAGVVYSFFTRNFAVMAKDMVDLLRATKQHVDPNLLELAKERYTNDKQDTEMTAGESKRQRTGDDSEKDARPAADHKEDSSSAATGSDDSDAEAATANDHPGNRIVLRRAGYISDASSSSSDSDEE